MNILNLSNKTRRGLHVLGCIAILTCGSPGHGQAPPKKIVAVLDFSNAVIQTGVNSSNLQTNAPDVGKAVSQLLIAKLVQDGTVTVVERAAIDKVIAEQNLSNSDRADPRTAAKLGKILGADAIILGTITRYDYDEQLKGYVGQRRGRRGSASPQAKYDITARIQVSTRVISPDTAEVLAVSEGVGETATKNVVMDVRDTTGHVMQAVGMNNPTVNETLDKAVAQLAAKVEAALVQLPRRTEVKYRL
jgi:curli biogenesis system outer membrane secretion channel CsgG